MPVVKAGAGSLANHSLSPKALPEEMPVTSIHCTGPQLQGSIGQGGTILPHTQEENVMSVTWAVPYIIVKISETGFTFITILQMRNLCTEVNTLSRGT